MSSAIPASSTLPAHRPACWKRWNWHGTQARRVWPPNNPCAVNHQHSELVSRFETGHGKHAGLEGLSDLDSDVDMDHPLHLTEASFGDQPHPPPPARLPPSPLPQLAPPTQCMADALRARRPCLCAQCLHTYTSLQDTSIKLDDAFITKKDRLQHGLPMANR